MKKRNLIIVMLFTISMVQAGTVNTVNADKVKQLYNEHCFVCHYAGGASSPKVGDANAWNPRIKQGKEKLLKHTIDGLNFMPAKGSCERCSAQELEAIIDYMLAQCPACEKLPAKVKQAKKTK